MDFRGPSPDLLLSTSVGDLASCQILGEFLEKELHGAWILQLNPFFYSVDTVGAVRRVPWKFTSREDRDGMEGFGQAR